MMRALLIGSVLLAGSSYGYQLRHDSQGDVVRWATRVRFVVDQRLEAGLSEGRAADALTAAMQASAAAAPGLQVELVRGRIGALGFTPEDGDLGNVVTAVDEWPFEAGNVAATIVTVDARSNTILDADIVFNAEEYKFKVLERAVPGQARLYDVQTVFTHELGHALGLQHEPSVRDAVMFPAGTPGQLEKRTLAADDRAGLDALYPEQVATPDADGEPQVGCAAAPVGSAVPALVLLAALRLSRRRARGLAVAARSSRRRTLGLLPLLGALLALPAFADGPAPVVAGPEVEKALRGEVIFTRSFWVDPQLRLMATDVEVKVLQCEKGVCAEERVLLRRPGGRIGDLEQYVTHQPQLDVGDSVLLTWTRGKVRIAEHLPRPRARPGH